MEEDKKSTAVQPEEAPKPKPRRRKSASPQPAADTSPAPTDSADHKKACRVPQEAAGQKKRKDNKNRKAQDAEGC